MSANISSARKPAEARKRKEDTSALMVPVDESKQLTARQAHPKVTDRQAELVAAMLQDGMNVANAAKTIKAHRSWAWQTLQKPHVLAYAHELARSVLGVAAIEALGTSRTLLNAKSEWLRHAVSVDLMDRAGFRVQAPQSKAPAVEVNINLD